MHQRCRVQRRAGALYARRQHCCDSCGRGSCVPTPAAVIQTLRDGIHSNPHLSSAAPVSVSVPGCQRDTASLRRSQSDVENAHNPK